MYRIQEELDFKDIFYSCVRYIPQKRTVRYCVTRFKQVETRNPKQRAKTSEEKKKMKLFKFRGIVCQTRSSLGYPREHTRGIEKANRIKFCAPAKR